MRSSRLRPLFASVILFSPMAELPSSSASREKPGVWEATRVNKGPLPMDDQVVGKDGLTHAVRLHAMTIRILKNGRFSAALKYRRAILSKHEKIDAQPLLNDTWVGSYTQTGAKMRFVPEKHGDQQVQPFSGESVGRRITIAFDYEIVTRKHYVLDLDRNDRIF
jgi:hypothetical protein